MKNLITLFLLHFSFFLNAQNNGCDNVKIYESNFDIYLQNEFEKNKNDTVLVFHRCGSSNGCYHRYAIIAWYENGRLFVQEHRKNGTNTKANKSIFKHIEVFFNDKIYATPKTDRIQRNYTIIVDDGPIEFYKLKVNDTCWSFSNSYNSENPIISKWINELSIKLIRIENKIKRLNKSKK